MKEIGCVEYLLFLNAKSISAIASEDRELKELLSFTKALYGKVKTLAMHKKIMVTVLMKRWKY